MACFCDPASVPLRLRGLPRADPFGLIVPVAETPLSRLLGLALLDRQAAGPGLLIPRCRAVHTIGMRFRLDVLFLDTGGRVIEARRAVRPGRLLICRTAASALELPAGGHTTRRGRLPRSRH